MPDRQKARETGIFDRTGNRTIISARIPGPRAEVGLTDVRFGPLSFGLSGISPASRAARGDRRNGWYAGGTEYAGLVLP